MDILTLGKMNAMAKNTGMALELMANHLYETQAEVCEFQQDNLGTIQSAIATGLSDLQNFVAESAGNLLTHFFIYNTNHWGATNGGCCLQWTVPTGTSVVNFEILSGGGPGGSAGYDFDIGHGGAGGNYNEKTLCRDAGDFLSAEGSEAVFSLCAGGTSYCSCCTTCNRACRHGCTSYVNGPGLSNFCAIGGHGGSTSWDVQSSCYNCHIGGNQCDRGNYNGPWVSHNCNEATYGGDMCFRGAAAGMHKGYSCCNEIQNGQGSPTGPYTAPWTGSANHYCAGDMACCAGHSIFPGGGGVGDGNAAGTPCTGGFGAGGLIKVTYQ